MIVLAVDTIFITSTFSKILSNVFVKIPTKRSEICLKIECLKTVSMTEKLKYDKVKWLEITSTRMKILQNW